jgi:hypothetical protein
MAFGCVAALLLPRRASPMLRMGGEDHRCRAGQLCNPIPAELGTHQMAVQHLVGDRADGLNDHWADGDVGHEATVHDINMDPVATSLVDGPDLQVRSKSG